MHKDGKYQVGGEWKGRKEQERFGDGRCEVCTHAGLPAVRREVLEFRFSQFLRKKVSGFS